MEMALRAFERDIRRPAPWGAERLSVFGLNHGFFEAGPDTFATFDAKRVIDFGISVSVLRYGSDRAYFDEGAHVIVGAEVLVNFYHCWFIVL